MSTWIFVRHGQSVANAEGWFAGQRDSPLTSLGETQAIAARQQLQAQPLSRALCSDLRRAQRTAELLLTGRDVPLQVTTALRERSSGEWEGRSIAELRASGAMEQAYYPWRANPPGGETLYEVALRAMAFLAQVDAPQPTLVVAHGALLRAVIGVVDGTPTDQIGRWRPDNCEIIVRTLEVGTWGRLHRQLLDEG